VEVDDKTAKAWSSMSPKQRKQIEKSLPEALRYSLSKTKEANFERLLQDVRDEAAKNGLTEDILNQLLSEED
jgi:hypothetical protein